MKKKSRDRRKAYRANKRYYLNLIKDFAQELPFKIASPTEIVPQGIGLHFFSDDKSDLPKFINPFNDENSTTK